MKRGLFRPPTNVLAIKPEALSIYWEWGIGQENVTRGRTTIVAIDGPLCQRSFWTDGYDAIVDRFKAAIADESTTTVLLRISSPGGECAGLYEAIRVMREAAASSGKRIVAYADEHAYSAAYALACVADEIYLPRAGGVGSVGVICVAYDRVASNERWGINVRVVHAGARKADCHPDLPLSDDAISGLQADVDALAIMFHELVAEARGVKADAIAALEADCFMGEAAIAAGLADGVMGFDEVLDMIEADDQQGAAASTEKEEDMGKKAARTLASEVDALDPLAKPIVGNPNPADMAAAADRLAASSDTSAEEEDCEDEGEGEDSAEESSDEESSEDGEGEGEGDGEEEEEEGEEEAAAPAPPKSTSTSGDVLRLVRELTGETSPAAQVGALTAMRDKAGKADKAERRAARSEAKSKSTELKALVDGAVRAGKLEPAQRAWAMSQPIETVRGYLKNASAVVPRTPLRAKPSKVNNAASSQASVVTEAIGNVAKAMQMDPAAIAKHADELRAKGVIH